MPKTAQGEDEQSSADQGHGDKLRPDHIQSGISKQHGLRQHDEMRVGCGEHDGLDGLRHAFAWGYPPDSSCSGISTIMSRSPNCGIEPATVARKIPRQAMAKTTLRADAVNTTSPIDQTLLTVISKAVTFELYQEVVAPGGIIANTGVHGVKADLHLEKL